MNLQTVAAKDFAWARTQSALGNALAQTAAIVERVQSQGDAAVRAYTAEFDRCPLLLDTSTPLRVDDCELERAYTSLSRELKMALANAKERIEDFHTACMPSLVHQTGDTGEQLGLVWRPIRRVGVYAPGGRGAYPSTVLMDVVPARVAGCTEITLASPPAGPDGLPHRLVLAAAYLCGVTEVYRIGGAQAIAAFAYGTESVKRVDKIVGPGNQYVALAKRHVMGDVGIDSIAGPSEVFIVADEQANAAWIAADMLAQAEHDVEAGAVCVTTSSTLAAQVIEALTEQLGKLPRRAIATEALERWGAIVIAPSLNDAVDVVNASAPEHVELHVRQPELWLDQIHTAGAVFLGEMTPEPVGDYYAGPNHVLPTHGSARYASGLGVHDFLRRMSFVKYNRETLAKHAADIARLAETEDLFGHAEAVRIRLSREDYA